MTNYTTINYELKRKFANTLSNMYSKQEFKDRRTIYDLVYGISSSKSLMISEISRSLNEDININSTITRLDRNINDENFKLDLLSSSYVNQVKSITPTHLVINVDDTDIIKPFGNKFEYLGMVRDGSTGNIVKGYPVLEMTTSSLYAKQPITIYSEMYSSVVKEHKSKNVVLFEALSNVVEKYGNDITFVFDRGYDDIKLMKYLKELKVKYIIRMTDNRKVKYQAKTLTAKQLRQKCKGKINETFESGDDKYELKISHLKVTLCSDNKTKLYSVVVHGFSEDPLKSMILLTNCEIRGKNDVKQVFWRYIKRWEIEETFRYC